MDELMIENIELLDQLLCLSENLESEIKSERRKIRDADPLYALLSQVEYELVKMNGFVSSIKKYNSTSTIDQRLRASGIEVISRAEESFDPSTHPHICNFIYSLKSLSMALRLIEQR